MDVLKKNSIMSVTCERCGITTRSNYDMRRHMMTHDNIKLFKCQYCEQKFSRKSKLKLHIDSRCKIIKGLRHGEINSHFIATWKNNQITTQQENHLLIKQHKQQGLIKQQQQYEQDQRKEELGNIKVEESVQVRHNPNEFSEEKAKHHGEHGKGMCL